MEYKDNGKIKNINNSPTQQAFRQSLVSGTGKNIFICHSMKCNNQYVPEQDPNISVKPKPEAVIAINPIMCVGCSAVFCKGCETGEFDRSKRQEKVNIEKNTAQNI